jgi:Fur family iron response transcriptional regulator
MTYPLNPARLPQLTERLKIIGLRPTQQRLALADLLFSAGDRHVSAEALHLEAQSAGVSVSLATVYNTLNRFREVGLLKEVSVDSGRSYFDTNLTPHIHIFNEVTSELYDAPLCLRPEVFEALAPASTEAVSVEVVVRVRPSAHPRSASEAQER